MRFTLATMSLLVGLAGTLGFEPSASLALECIDYSDTNDPFVATVFSGTTRRADIQDGIGYLANNNGLELRDLANPADPAHLGTWYGSEPANDVSVSGDFAFLAHGHTGLTVVDISSIDDLTFVTSLALPGESFGIDVAGSFAYVAEWGEGLQVIDISTPSSPVIRGSVTTPNFALGVQVVDGYAYIADRASGLQVADVSDPDNPILVGSLETGHIATDVHVEGGIAYVADTWGGVWIIDVSTPSSPQQLAAVTFSDNVFGVSGANGFLYLALQETGMVVLDVVEPTLPVTLAVVPVAGSNAEVHLEDSIVLYGSSNRLLVGPEQCRDAASIDAVSPEVTTGGGGLSVFPQPSRGAATISYDLAVPSAVHLRIADASGRTIRTLRSGEVETAGRHEWIWDGLDDRGRSVAHGVYYARLDGPRGARAGRIVRLR